MDNEEKYNETRRLFTNKKSKFLTNFILPSYDVEGYDMNSEVDDIQQIVHAHLVRIKIDVNNAKILF